MASSNKNAAFPVYDKTKKNVVFVLYDKVTLVDFVGATEVFNNVFVNNKPLYNIHWLAPGLAPITTSENMRVLPTGTFTEPVPGLKTLKNIDILFVPGGNWEGIANCMTDKAYMQFITNTAKHATWTGSVCTGAFLLAATGELTKCLATTYWSQLNNLSLMAAKYNFTVVPGYPRFLLDDARKRFTGGGISSSLDLALKLTEQLYGKAVAEKAQLFIQYAPGPSVSAGDPAEAPPVISAEVQAMQTGYTGGFQQFLQGFLKGKK
ncbi:MAG: DJ-1/PfpI family protein [Ferruginibacter sp.]